MSIHVQQYHLKTGEIGMFSILNVDIEVEGSIPLCVCDE
jgi:hypothetical protein